MPRISVNQMSLDLLVLDLLDFSRFLGVLAPALGADSFAT
jgi:hypothetical protein